MKNKIAIHLLSFICLFLISAASLAESNNKKSEDSIKGGNNQLYIPADLQPWVKWIEQKNPEWDCAYNNFTHICVWPGKLSYQLQEKGAEFSLQVSVLRESLVQLPAAAGLYPRNIRITDKYNNPVSAPFELNETSLQVKLPEGDFIVTGSFYWDKEISQLPVPDSYAVIELKADSEDLSKVRDSNYLRLEKTDSSDLADSVSLSVMRKITDGSPLTVETLIKLQVAGKSRPVEIKNLLVSGSEAISIQSYLPARLNQDGNLVLQLLPGTYEIRILAALQQPVSSLDCPLVSADFWPKEEIWTWWSDMQLRTVEVSGANPIDSQITQLPNEWRGSAAYVIKAGNSLKLDEKRRGQEMTLPNKINLNRELWLDLDSSGATILDNISGSLHQTSRLNIDNSVQLGRASSDGTPVLITLDPKTQQKGIEVRKNNLNFQVVSKVDSSKIVPASGWDQTIDGFSMTLNIPPAWRLLHVKGASSAQNAWIDNWSLLNIFLGVLLTLAIFKLFGLSTAAILALSLIINHNEFLAPNMLYVHLTILAALGNILKSFSQTWHSVSKGLLYATFGLFAIQSLAFAKLQIIEAIFPQLQSGTRYRTLMQSVLFAIEENLFFWPAALIFLGYTVFCLKKIIASNSIGAAVGRAVVSGLGLFVFIPVLGIIVQTLDFSPSRNRQGSYQTKSFGNVIQESAMPSEVGSYNDERMSKFQYSGKAAAKKSEEFSFSNKNSAAGPALPEWQWKKSLIQVATPLDPKHQLQFYLIPPGLGKFICVLRAIIILSLALLLFNKLGLRIPRPKYISTATVVPSLSGLMLLLSCLLFSQQARAEIPPSEMLKELEERLASTHCKQKYCTTIDSINIKISGSELTIKIKAISDGRSFINIPGPLDRFDLKKARVNSEDSGMLRRNQNGFLEVLTEDGENIIEVFATLPKVDNFNLQFQQKALATLVESPDWFVEGLDDKGQVRDSLRFIRQSLTNVGKEEQSKSIVQNKTELASWIKVTRTFFLSDKFNIPIRIERLGDTERASKAVFSLLKDEKLLSQNAMSDQNNVEINFAPGQKFEELHSVMPFTSELHLTASKAERVIEEWQIRCDTFLSCSYSGIKPVSTSMNDDKIMVFLPFPSEQLSVSTLNLNSPKGDFYSIDKATHEISWGSNLLEGTVSVKLRATQQSNFWIKLPENSKLLDVSINGQSGQSSSLDGKVLFVLNPGEHNLLSTYSMSWNPNLRESAPSVELAGNANNVSVIIKPSADRWILWLGGEGWGPAVVFWTKLLVIALICLAICRYQIIKISLISSFLFATGLAVLPVWSICFPLAWLLAIHNLPSLQGKLNFIPRWLGLTGFSVILVISIALWFSVIQSGLLFSPPMLIAGNGSSSFMLKWYLDYSDSSMPEPYVISVPIWYFRMFALLWSSWLSISLFRWLKDSIEIFKLPVFGEKKVTDKSSASSAVV